MVFTEAVVLQHPPSPLKTSHSSTSDALFPDSLFVLAPSVLPGDSSQLADFRQRSHSTSRQASLEPTGVGSASQLAVQPAVPPAGVTTAHPVTQPASKAPSQPAGRLASQTARPAAKKADGHVSGKLPDVLSLSDMGPAVISHEHSLPRSKKQELINFENLKQKLDELTKPKKDSSALKMTDLESKASFSVPSTPQKTPSSTVPHASTAVAVAPSMVPSSSNANTSPSTLLFGDAKRETQMSPGPGQQQELPSACSGAAEPAGVEPAKKASEATASTAAGSFYLGPTAPADACPPGPVTSAPTPVGVNAPLAAVVPLDTEPGATANIQPAVPRQTLEPLRQQSQPVLAAHTQPKSSQAPPEPQPPMSAQPTASMQPHAPQHQQPRSTNAPLQQLQPPASAQHQPPATSQLQHQPPATAQLPHQPSASAQLQPPATAKHHVPATAQLQHPPPASAHHQPPASAQLQHQQPASAHIQHQAPATAQLQHQQQQLHMPAVSTQLQPAQQLLQPHLHQPPLSSHQLHTQQQQQHQQQQQQQQLRQQLHHQQQQLPLQQLSAHQLPPQCAYPVPHPAAITIEQAQQIIAMQRAQLLSQQMTLLQQTQLLHSQLPADVGTASVAPAVRPGVVSPTHGDTKQKKLDRQDLASLEQQLLKLRRPRRWPQAGGGLLPDMPQTFFAHTPQGIQLVTAPFLPPGAGLELGEEAAPALPARVGSPTAPSTPPPLKEPPIGGTLLGSPLVSAAESNAKHKASRFSVTIVREDSLAREKTEELAARPILVAPAAVRPGPGDTQPDADAQPPTSAPDAAGHVKKADDGRRAPPQVIRKGRFKVTTIKDGAASDVVLSAHANENQNAVSGAPQVTPSTGCLAGGRDDARAMSDTPPCDGVTASTSAKQPIVMPTLQQQMALNAHCVSDARFTKYSFCTSLHLFSINHFPNVSGRTSRTWQCGSFDYHDIHRHKI